LKYKGKQALADAVKYKDIKKSETEHIRGIYSYMVGGGAGGHGQKGVHICFTQKLLWDWYGL